MSGRQCCQAEHERDPLPWESLEDAHPLGATFGRLQCASAHGEWTDTDSFVQVGEAKSVMAWVYTGQRHSARKLQAVPCWQKLQLVQALAPGLHALPCVTWSPALRAWHAGLHRRPLVDLATPLAEELRLLGQAHPFLRPARAWETLAAQSPAQQSPT
jgi:hypothetical protein